MFSGKSGKGMKRTDTNRSGGNELHRTTSSYQGSVADGMRYSDRPSMAAERERVTASQLHKTKTMEERIRQAEKENRARAAAQA